eukprot:TRINITY_DN38256_c0_g1_i1.p1 TRINITY_DN38256_c0_g1~~TRINITY_DN38256_c0_g1_i1.p1  ORF type:complete len:340 (-),score=61.39 TRINITY_DN38256_c0_g1_i1:106-1125(-)
MAPSRSPRAVGSGAACGASVGGSGGVCAPARPSISGCGAAQACRARSTSLKLPKDAESRLQALERRCNAGFLGGGGGGGVDGRLRCIEDKLDQLIFLLQSNALEVVMKLSPEEMKRFEAALEEVGCGIPRPDAAMVATRQEAPAPVTNSAPAHPAQQRPDLRTGASASAAVEAAQRRRSPPADRSSGVLRPGGASTLPRAGRSVSASRGSTAAAAAGTSVSAEAETMFPAWATEDLVQITGEWSEISASCPVRVGSVVMVATPFCSDDEDHVPLEAGLRLRVVNVDEDGDLLVYCPLWAAGRAPAALNRQPESAAPVAPADCPRWVGARNFNHLRILAS